MVALAAALVSSCVVPQPGPAAYSAPQLRARIVDSHTNKPIAGAVVTGDWLTWGQAVQPGHGSSSFATFHRAEGKTDTDGWLVLPGWGPELRPYYERMSQFSPRLRVFKADYYPRIVSNQRAVNPDATVIMSDWNGKAIELDPFNGDWLRYVRGLNAMWEQPSPNECACPSMTEAVVAELERIRPVLPLHAKRFAHYPAQRQPVTPPVEIRSDFGKPVK